MSNLNEQDIAEWKSKQMGLFQVEEIEAINFDENGQENGTWNGFSVTKIDDPANYCFDCRDKINADKLCDFLNNECIVDVDNSIDAFVLDNCTEWANLITELSHKEVELYECKEEYQRLSDNCIEVARANNFDFKKHYGGDNQQTRKQYVKETLSKETEHIKQLEFRIDYISRRISYLKALVPVKTALIGVKK